MKFDNSVPITGATVACSIGTSLAEVSANLHAGRSGATFQHRFAEWSKNPLAPIFVNNASNKQPSNSKISVAEDTILGDMACSSMSSLLAETQVLQRYHPSEIGLFIGTSTAGVERSLEPICRYLDLNKADLRDHLTRIHLHGSLENLLRKRFPIAGFGATFATACSSSAVAIVEGVQAIRMGVVPACIVGGFDVLSLMTILGFEALQIVSPEPCCPFAPNSLGITLGEGGAFLLLESGEAKRIVERTIGHVTGIGLSSDGYHITQPDPSGAGMMLAMRRALANADVAPHEIGYINAHGTGTKQNDEAETKAIAAVFGNNVAVSSTKGWHGHALGASGAIEAVVALLALHEKRAWRGNCGCGDLLSDKISEQMSDKIRHAKGEYISDLCYAMSNSFGFGGSNVSLIFSAADSDGGRH